MAKSYTLNARDRQVLNRVIKIVLGNPEGGGKTDPWNDDDRDTYIVIAPSGGIPARVGTTAGNAQCVVQRVIRETGVIDDTTVVTEDVFNVATSAIEEGSYAVAARDNYGALVIGSAGGGGDPIEIIRFKLTEDWDTGITTSDAIQTDVNGVGGVDIELQDALPLFVPLPRTTRGYAVKLGDTPEPTGTGVERYEVIQAQCFECETEDEGPVNPGPGTGTGP